VIADQIDRHSVDTAFPALIPALSPRQRTIVGLIARGLPDKQIAKELGVTRRTVRTQLERLYRRHGIHSKPQAVALLLALATGGARVDDG